MTPLHDPAPTPPLTPPQGGQVALPPAPGADPVPAPAPLRGGTGSEGRGHDPAPDRRGAVSPDCVVGKCP